MGRPIHFEIHADSPERAIGFYKQVFGWSFSRWPGPMDYWIISTGDKSEPGIDGGLIKRMGLPPVDGQAVNSYVCTIGVTDLDRSIAQAAEFNCPLAVEKMPIPGVGWLAYIKDTEGNIVGLMQSDPTAGS